MFNSDEYLMISGLQHFSFCRRQWALIHLEQQWEENVYTAQGKIEHTRCHDESQREKRGEVITIRGLRVISHSLKLTGNCDVVEFHSSPQGIPIQYAQGTWMPFPIEYKHGHSKIYDADRLQLCAQAIALEEMLVCSIPRGALFYQETRKREYVEFDNELRKKTISMAEEMWSYYQKQYTPKEKEKKCCHNCSLYSVCLPSLNKRKNVKAYIDNALKD